MIILVFINEYKLGHVRLVVTRFVELKLLVTVRLPENVLFTPANCNPDDVLECRTMFKFCQKSGVLLNFHKLTMYRHFVLLD